MAYKTHFQVAYSHVFILQLFFSETGFTKL